MFHSILIPHRNRQTHLSLCLDSIYRSAERCSVTDYEVVVVDDGSDHLTPWVLEPPVRVVRNRDRTHLFNRARLLNHAIAEARGDVLSFLDCDVVVGRRWMDCARLAPDYHRICYRVRYLRPYPSKRILAARSDIARRRVRRYFRCYSRFRIHHEGYTRISPGGNSQFTCTRERLADLRYDERYEGWGYEDLDLIQQFARRYGKDYRSIIHTDAHHALLHLWHPHDDRREEQTLANRRLYHETWKESTLS